ncbi:MAG: molybdopterin-dependent oxidoreductase [Micromonosporaceae bacterium]
MNDLPPGQRTGEWLPFGLPRFASRRPAAPGQPVLHVGGAVRSCVDIDLAEPPDPGEPPCSPKEPCPPKEQRSDLHCVTTWSVQGIHWGGYRFQDLHERLEPEPDCRWLVLKGSDGFRSCLYLTDALAADVMVAVRLDGAPIPVERGGPIRLVAPGHYGYKSVKHLYAIEYHHAYRPGSAGWTEHPRGRVAYEERSRFLPGWAWRPLWRASIPGVKAVWRRGESGMAPTSHTFRAACERRHPRQLDSAHRFHSPGTRCDLWGRRVADRPGQKARN